MIDGKTAARNALQYLTELGFTGPVTNVTLEELELSDDGVYWLVTLSYYESSVMLGKPKYKIFKVRTDDGSVVSMRIRETAQ